MPYLVYCDAGPPSKGAFRLKAEIFSEIEAPDLLIGHDGIRLAFRQDAAGMDDVGAVDQSQGLADIVVRDEHADAAAGQVAHEILNVADRDRVDAREGFVKQHEGRLASERAGDLATPSL